MESLFAALGEPRRLDLLRRLVRWEGAATQAELREVLDLGDNEKSGVSRDLAHLVGSGLISKEGRKRYRAVVTATELDELLRQAARLDTELSRRRAARAEEREQTLAEEHASALQYPPAVDSEGAAHGQG